ncbi:MAG: hypothetical protein FWE26_06610 [Coriobacteriia bacterium]|nr:hypothetical protein [Coriobacteriia bacterium]MCL2871273.1 hypothetical protein [Coriobacteriia bacterium]
MGRESLLPELQDEGTLTYLMTYFYRNPQHEDQQQVQQPAERVAPAYSYPPQRPRRGCLTAFAVVSALILIVAAVAVAFTMHAARQLEQEIVENNPAVESLLEERDISMIDLIMLSRELEGASREEAIQRAQEMGISEQELRELATDSEVRELIEQFMGR